MGIVGYGEAGLEQCSVETKRWQMAVAGTDPSKLLQTEAQL